MRCFISVNLPKEIFEQIREFSKTIMNYDILIGNFVEPENMHLTPKFLGDISEEKVKEIKKVLEQIKFKPFEISFKGLGGFPSENYIRVLWLGVDKGAGELTKLQKDIEEKITRIGFQKEKQFVPHLTLARVKFVRDKAALGKMFDNNRNVEVGSFWCDKIHFMKSELLQDGARYFKL